MITTPKNTLARYRTAMLTNAELQAGFLAARQFGKILDDEVIAAIVQAVAALQQNPHAEA